MATGSKVECDSMRVEACILLCLSVLRCTQKAECAHKLQLHGSVASISGRLEYNAARTFSFVYTFFLRFCVVCKYRVHKGISTAMFYPVLSELIHFLGTVESGR